MKRTLYQIDLATYAISEFDLDNETNDETDAPYTFTQLKDMFDKLCQHIKCINGNYRKWCESTPAPRIRRFIADADRYLRFHPTDSTAQFMRESMQKQLENV